MDIFVIIFVIYIGYIALSFIITLVQEQNTIKEKDRQEKHTIDNWLAVEELQYRELHTYPPDWGMRRQYIAKFYQYTCQICFKKGWLGFHVHHILPLSRGGNNNLENLTYLCKFCHENQHPHMIEERKKRYWNRKKYYSSKKIRYS